MWGLTEIFYMPQETHAEPKLSNSVKVSQASHMGVWLSNHLKDG